MLRKMMIPLIGIILIGVVLSFTGCSLLDSEDKPEPQTKESTLTITNISGHSGKYIAGVGDPVADKALIFATSTPSATSVLGANVTATTTLKVYVADYAEGSIQWAQVAPYTGTHTLQPGKLILSVIGTQNFQTSTDDIDFVNKVPITFSNGSATIYFSTQMEQRGGDDDPITVTVTDIPDAQYMGKGGWVVFFDNSDSAVALTDITQISDGEFSGTLKVPGSGELFNTSGTYKARLYIEDEAETLLYRGLKNSVSITAGTPVSISFDEFTPDLSQQDVVYIITGNDHLTPDYEDGNTFITFQASAAGVTGFAFVSIEEVDDGNGTGFAPLAVLHLHGELNTEVPLTIKTDISEGIPTNGIVYKYNGEVKCFYLREDIDSSIELVPFTPKEPPLMSITPGQERTSYIMAGTSHYYTFTLLNPTALKIIAAGEELYPLLTVYDEELNEVASDYGYMEHAFIAGVYYLRVSTFNDEGSGSYTLNLNAIDLSALAQSITIGTWKTVDVAEPGGAHWFSFTASASSQYIHFWPGYPIRQINVELFDSGYSSLGKADLWNSQDPEDMYEQYTGLSAGQTYYIKANALTPEDGNFYLTVNGTSDTPEFD